MVNWKQKERDVAKFFNTERTPLSGGNSKITRSDTLHPLLFIEQKHRKKHAVIELWKKTKALAKLEKKLPIVSLTQEKTHGKFFLIQDNDLKFLIKCLKCIHILEYIDNDPDHIDGEYLWEQEKYTNMAIDLELIVYSNDTYHLTSRGRLILSL